MHHLDAPSSEDVLTNSILKKEEKKKYLNYIIALVSKRRVPRSDATG